MKVHWVILKNIFVQRFVFMYLIGLYTTIGNQVDFLRPLAKVWITVLNRCLLVWLKKGSNRIKIFDWSEHSLVDVWLSSCFCPSSTGRQQGRPPPNMEERPATHGLNPAAQMVCDWLENPVLPLLETTKYTFKTVKLSGNFCGIFYRFSIFVAQRFFSQMSLFFAQM